MSRTLLLIPIALLAACGQTGDLYLPAPPEREAVPAAPAESPALPATTEDEEDRADNVPGAATSTDNGGR